MGWLQRHFGVSRKDLKDVAEFSENVVLRYVLNTSPLKVLGRIKLWGYEVRVYNREARKFNCRFLGYDADTMRSVDQVGLV